MRRVKEFEVPADANIILSHTFFNIKTEDNGELRLKDRIAVHGNLVAEKDDVHADCAAADLLMVRLILCLGTCLAFKIGLADIKRAFIQYGPITRDGYVRPPSDCPQERGELCKLLKLPYEMREGGRRWLLKIDEWMVNDYGLERIPGVPRLFEKGMDRISNWWWPKRRKISWRLAKRRIYCI